MAENIISSGFLAFLLFYFAFSSNFPSSIGAAKFTLSPQNITEVTSPDNVTLIWNYTVDSKLEFKDNSPVWEYKSPSGSWQRIASEDGLDGWKWKISSQCPRHLLGRVYKESVATLVINNTIPANSGRYRCTLVLSSSEDIPSEVEVIVKAQLTTPGPTTSTTDINECVSNPCKNGGTCTDLVNGFVCTCAPGWEGDDCSQDIDECASNPCKNGATCTDLLNGFRCTCASGYEGQDCSEIKPTPKPTCPDYPYKAIIQFKLTIKNFKTVYQNLKGWLIAKIRISFEKKLTFCDVSLVVDGKSYTATLVFKDKVTEPDVTREFEAFKMKVEGNVTIVTLSIKIESPPLTPAEIAGIVIGVVALIAIIAIVIVVIIKKKKAQKNLAEQGSEMKNKPSSSEKPE